MFWFILFVAVNNIQCRQFTDGNTDFCFPCQSVQAMVTWIQMLNAIHWQYRRFFIAFRYTRDRVCMEGPRNNSPKYSLTTTYFCSLDSPVFN